MDKKTLFVVGGAAAAALVVGSAFILGTTKTSGSATKKEKAAALIVDAGDAVALNNDVIDAISVADETPPDAIAENGAPSAQGAASDQAAADGTAAPASDDQKPKKQKRLWPW